MLILKTLNIHSGVWGAGGCCWVTVEEKLWGNLVHGSPIVNALCQQLQWESGTILSLCRKHYNEVALGKQLPREREASSQMSLRRISLECQNWNWEIQIQLPALPWKLASWPLTSLTLSAELTSQHCCCEDKMEEDRMMLYATFHSIGIGKS